MGVFGVVFGCRGDGGFNGRCLGVSIGDGGFMLACISGCRGVIGFNVATSQQPVREKVRPARPGVDASAKKFAQRAQNTPNSAILCQQGEFSLVQGQNASCWAKNVSPTGAAIRLAAHATTSMPTARLECAVKLVARGYCTTWGPLHCFVASAMLRYLVHCLPK